MCEKEAVIVVRPEFMSVNIFSHPLFFVQNTRGSKKGPGARSAHLQAAGDSGTEGAGGPVTCKHPVPGGDHPEAEGAGAAGHVWSSPTTLTSDNGSAAKLALAQTKPYSVLS